MGMITYDDGTQEWREDGRLHRLDGPAVIHDSGYQAWWVDGHLHRLDGPARFWADGSQEWYVNHKNITQEVTAWIAQRNITWPWDQEAQMEFMLTWA